MMRDLECDKTGFDVVANFDCVYEPLYTKIYQLLVDVMNELLITNPKCVAVTIMERRCSEGTHMFLHMTQRFYAMSKVEKFILMIIIELKFVVFMVCVRLYL